MIAPEEAFALVAERVTPVEASERSLRDALGAVLREEARSQTDLPPFDQSAMDGYAVATRDVAAGAALPLRGVSAAAPVDEVPTLEPGHAMRIFTGGPLPRGADAVVPQEDVAREGDSARFSAGVAPGACVRRRGEEVARGDVLLPAGARLDAGRVAALAMAGLDRVRVSRTVRVACFVGGDEIVPAGSTLGPGQVYDANGPLLRAWFAGEDAAVSVSTLPDDRAATERALDEALRTHDVVFTTGGVSVGERDFVVPAARAIDVDEGFWKVAQKPGKPLYFGTREGAVLVGFPGNPGAVFTGLALFGRLVLDRRMGASDPGVRWRTGVLQGAVRRPRGRALWLRVTAREDAEGRTLLEPLPKQASHMLSNLASCDALAWVPRGEGPALAGELVRWTPTGAPR